MERIVIHIKNTLKKDRSELCTKLYTLSTAFAAG